jgi:hypothetical protein
MAKPILERSFGKSVRLLRAYSFLSTSLRETGFQIHLQGRAFTQSQRS